MKDSYIHMFQVILGGGRRSFIPKDEMDPETGYNSYQGRLDGRNLINVSVTFFYATKPVFRVSYKARLKAVPEATKSS